MIKHRLLRKSVIYLAAFVLFISCEIPNSPNVSFESKIELPLIKEKRFYFYGGSDSFIDTTKGEIDTLFSVNSENIVFISFTDSVEIGDLDDAIPTINIDTSTIESEVGVIEIDDFSSDFSAEVGFFEQEPEAMDDTNAEVGTFEPDFNGSGQADFNTITGFNPPAIPDPILASTTTINIALDAGDFVSATIESGSLSVSFTNNLGFNIQTLEAQLVGNTDFNPVDIGSLLQFNSVNHGESVSDFIVFNNGDILETDLEMQVTITWDNQNYQVNSDNNLDVSVSNSTMVVSQANSEITAQALTPDTPDITISDPNFSNARLSNNSGSDINRLHIIVSNNTNIPLSNSSFNTYPSITLRNSNGDILDQTKQLIPDGSIESVVGAGETATISFDLSDELLTSVLSYALDIGTPGSNGLPVTLSSTDAISIQVSTTNLEVAVALSAVDPQNDITLSDTTVVDGDFVRAEVSNGSLSLDFTNTLNIDLNINTLTVFNKNAFVTKNTGRYIAAGSEIGSLSNITIPANSTASEVIDLSGKSISDEIIFEAVASSPGSNGVQISVSSTDEISIAVAGTIEVNEADATLKSQDFDSNDEIEIDRENFVFNNPSQYVRLKSGNLIINDIINDLDVDIDTLKITVPSITDKNGDILEIGFYGTTQSGFIFPKIRRQENLARNPVAIDMSGFRLSAPGNLVTYSVRGVTENTENSADPQRTIRSTDKVSASLTIEGLEIEEALGQVVQKEVILGEDDLSNGEDILDLMNDIEAEIIDNESFSDISDKLKNLEISGAELSILYTTNLGVKTTAYMAIAGKDSDGNYIFLQGKGNSQVTASDNITKLYNNGVQIDNSNLVKFSIGKNASSNPGLYDGSITFNSSNSNVDEFLSKLPSEIRTLGIAIVNPDNANSSFITNPIEFITQLSTDIPLALGTSGGPLTIENTFKEIGISGIPEDDDNVVINEVDFKIIFENRIPLALGLELIFSDSLGNAIEIDYQPLSIDAAQVDANGFSTIPAEGFVNLIITSPNALNNVADITLKIHANSSGNQIVKIQPRDYIQLKVSITTSYNPNFGN